MPIILITGASGFVGRYIFTKLKTAGMNVFGTASKPGCDGLLACDITVESSINEVFDEVQPDIVIHAAALSSVVKGTTMDYYRVNVLGTENVMKAVNRLGGKRRLIFLSTAGVYGNQGVEVLHENLCPQPVHHYGCSKLVSELMLMNETERHDISILRLFNVIGSGQEESFIVPKLARHFKNRLAEIELGNLEPERDYLPVETVAEVVRRLIDNEKSYGEIVNVAAGTGTSVKMLLNLMTDITGHQIRVISSEQFTRKNEVWRLVGSTEKLREIIGALPDVDLRYTIETVLSN